MASAPPAAPPAAAPAAPAAVAGASNLGAGKLSCVNSCLIISGGTFLPTKNFATSSLSVGEPASCQWRNNPLSVTLVVASRHESPAQLPKRFRPPSMPRMSLPPSGPCPVVLNLPSGSAAK